MNITALAKRNGEEKGVRESAVAPEVTVADAESESDHIKVGNHRAERTHDPNSFWRARAVETCSYAEGRHHM
jgi:hypothetical protein